MAVALVTNASPEEGKGKAILAVYIYRNKKCYDKRCTLLTRRSAVLAVDIMHGRSLSCKMRPQLQLKKTKVRLN